MLIVTTTTNLEPAIPVWRSNRRADTETAHSATDSLQYSRPKWFPWLARVGLRTASRGVTRGHLAVMVLRNGHLHTSLREQPGGTFTDPLRAGQRAVRAPELDSILTAVAITTTVVVITTTVVVDPVEGQDQHRIGHRDFHHAATRARGAEARRHDWIVPRSCRMAHGCRMNLRRTPGAPRRPGCAATAPPAETYQNGPVSLPERAPIVTLAPQLSVFSSVHQGYAPTGANGSRESGPAEGNQLETQAADQWGSARCRAPPGAKAR